MTVLSRSKNAAVFAWPAGRASGVDPCCVAADRCEAGSETVTRSRIGTVPTLLRNTCEMADQARCRRLQFDAASMLSMESKTCASMSCRVYSKDHSACAGCESARPPGADTRRPSPPPPWRGSSLIWTNSAPFVLPRLRPDRCGIMFSQRSDGPISPPSGSSAGVGSRSDSRPATVFSSSSTRLTVTCHIEQIRSPGSHLIVSDSTFVSLGTSSLRGRSSAKVRPWVGSTSGSACRCSTAIRVYRWPARRQVPHQRSRNRPLGYVGGGRTRPEVNAVHPPARHRHRFRPDNAVGVRHRPRQPVARPRRLRDRVGDRRQVRAASP